jgi:bacteriocin-like protein
MKTQKKEVAKFQKMTKNQMKSINGGVDIVILGPDGKKYTVPT